MSIFKPAAGEQPVFKGNATYYYRKMLAHQGELHITDQRIVFEKWMSPGASPVALLLFKKLRARIVFEIPLKNITRVYWKKFVLAKKITIETSDGISYPLIVDKFDDVTSILPKFEGELATA